METVILSGLRFIFGDDTVRLTDYFGSGEYNICDVQIAGEDKPSHLGIKFDNSSEGDRLKCVSHTFCDDKLRIVQQNERIRVVSEYARRKGSNAVMVNCEIENVSDKPLLLEEISVLKLVFFKGLSPDDIMFTRFTQSHHCECQPVTHTFREYGLFGTNGRGQKKISFANIGSWSTKEELPQGIIYSGDSFIMFQAESNNSWYYEISDKDDAYYLYVSGANAVYGDWNKILQPKSRYKSINAVLAFGSDIDSVVGEMTKYRRSIVERGAADNNLPTVFNEYMHLSWDSPTEENTKMIAAVAAKVGADYYVIDCGWHNEEKGSEVYPYVGQWKESNARFPHGVRAATDYIRSLGMKPGLWIEPEIVGIKCKEMLDYYDDDCFMQRKGRRISVMGRYFLNFRNRKVRAYLGETIRRMAEEYGAEYIKTDYNEDIGIGADNCADSYGEGLEENAKSYLDWIDEMRGRFPDVLFEACASGGMRMDYRTLSHFSMVSTSDQTDYRKYPYIAGNILSAVIPEQAAVWSYPVGAGIIGLPFDKDEQWVDEFISEERIVMNMINSFLGRMHLASHLEMLTESKLSLVKEGVEYYKELVAAKKNALPYFPIGFTDFGEKTVCAGLMTDDKIYLAVWNLNGDKKVSVPIKKKILSVRVGYPVSLPTNFLHTENSLEVTFSKDYQARFFEICCR